MLVVTLVFLLGLQAGECPDSLGPLWFCVDREIDLTGDGRFDTVRVWADGPSSDSLKIALSLIVDGRERWREDWASDYMLIDPSEVPEGEESRREYIRRDLLRTVASVSVQPFDPTSYMYMANQVDSTLVQDPPAREILFSYGYETTVVLMWDEDTEAFRLLWTCC